MKESNADPASSCHDRSDSQESSVNSQLSSLRQEIDSIDTTIWSLLEKRFDLSKNIAKIKHDLKIPILDEKREKDVLARIDALPCDQQVSSAIKQLYEFLFELSRKFQK